MITGDYHAENKKRIITDFGILFDGNYREKSMDSEICSFVEPFNSSQGTSDCDNLYHYNFCITTNNKDYQPNGAINLNKFNTIRVVKNNDEFIVFLNDSWYFNGKIEGKLYDYSDKVIYIGVANPYCENKNECWFSGEISDVKIYNSSNEIIDDLYLWFDFQNNSNFKTFDKSGNGNHGELYETEEFKYEKHIEFNKLARPAKII